jgi:hypothetical protein
LGVLILLAIQDLHSDEEECAEEGKEVDSFIRALDIGDGTSRDPRSVGENIPFRFDLPKSHPIGKKSICLMGKA